MSRSVSSFVSFLVSVSLLTACGAPSSPSAPGDSKLYTLDSAAAAEFAADAKIEVQDDDSGWVEAVQTSLADDLSGELAFSQATIEAVQHGIDSDIDAFAVLAVGGVYPSRAAAENAFLQFAISLERTVSSDYPDGVLSVVPELDEAAALARAKVAILHYFETVEVAQPDFQSNIGRTWADVEVPVKNDVGNFENGASYSVVRQGHRRIFIGKVYGLHTEATVDDVGKVTPIVIEVD